jgi:hypothetical protein
MKRYFYEPIISTIRRNRVLAWIQPVNGPLYPMEWRCRVVPIVSVSSNLEFLATLAMAGSLIAFFVCYLTAF